jgi:carnitine O-palmitoyltransferase 2
LTFNDDPIAEKNVQAQRAADMVVSSVKFKRTLDADLLRPDVFFMNNETRDGWLSDGGLFTAVMKMIPPGLQLPSFIAKDTSLHSAYGHMKGAYPLDMSQFKNLFNSTRVPAKGRDFVVKDESPPPYHVVVQRGPLFYTVQVTTDDGMPLSQSALRASFQSIIDGDAAAAAAAAAADASGTAAASSPPVGILTSWDRDSWAEARERLSETSPKNAAALDAIDRAMFVVCLSDAAPETESEVGSLMLHGDGRDRW